jgi:hypothetical protein
METYELADGGILLYDHAFLPPDLADKYFVELRDTCAWEQKPASFGHVPPRLKSSYSSLPWQRGLRRNDNAVGHPNWNLI